MPTKKTKKTRGKMKPNPTWADKEPKSEAGMTYEMPLKMSSFSDGKNKVSVGFSCDTADINEVDVRKLLVGANVEMELSDPREMKGQELLPGAGGDKKALSLAGEIGNVTMAPDHFSFSLRIALDAVNNLRKFKFRQSKAFISRIGDSNGNTAQEDADETGELTMGEEEAA